VTGQTSQERENGNLSYRELERAFPTEYPPDSSDPVHRHNAHGFIYVLEGSIVMQVRGGKEVTLTPGQTFYEGPEDVHVVGRNASQTKPAKFVVFFVKDKGAPVLVPTK
jgi:quercetin dioxygenase-like cupin family protein